MQHLDNDGAPLINPKVDFRTIIEKPLWHSISNTGGFRFRALAYGCHRNQQVLDILGRVMGSGSTLEKARMPQLPEKGGEMMTGGSKQWLESMVNQWLNNG